MNCYNLTYNVRLSGGVSPVAESGAFYFNR